MRCHPSCCHFTAGRLRQARRLLKCADRHPALLLGQHGEVLSGDAHASQSPAVRRYHLAGGRAGDDCPFLRNADTVGQAEVAHALACPGLVAGIYRTRSQPAHGRRRPGAHRQQALLPEPCWLLHGACDPSFSASRKPTTASATVRLGCSNVSLADRYPRHMETTRTLDPGFQADAPDRARAYIHAPTSK